MNELENLPDFAGATVWSVRASGTPEEGYGSASLFNASAFQFRKPHIPVRDDRHSHFNKNPTTTQGDPARAPAATLQLLPPKVVGCPNPPTRNNRPFRSIALIAVVDGDLYH
jgi:hypothetical protein